MKKRIRIIGGGWYGCHIAATLKEEGHEVTLFEKAGRLFAGASGNNQSRLHLGFHYPRDWNTRVEALSDSVKFMRAYGNMTRAVGCNVYSVAEEVSLIDYVTYRQIMEQSGNQFVEIRPDDFGMANTSGAMLTGERLILEDDAADFFENALCENVVLNQEITDLSEDDGFDWTVDCTFGAFGTHDVEWFEPCVMVLYEGDDDFALTVMDGPMGASIYPWYLPDTVSLTCVEHTPIHRSKTMEEALSKIDHFRRSEVRKDGVRHRMEERVSRYYPAFTREYVHQGFALSVRVKPKSGSDRRAFVISRPNQHVIRVFPGKITGILGAARHVKTMIETDAYGLAAVPVKAQAAGSN